MLRAPRPDMTTMPAHPIRRPHVALRIVAIAVMAAVAGCSTTVVRSPAPGARVPPPASTPRPGAFVTVQRGETLYRIATRHGIQVRDLAAWNGLVEPYTIHPGQRLRLYPESRATAVRPTARPRPQARPPATPPRVPAPRPAAPVAAPIDSGIAWRWPADGALLSRFAPSEPTRQGIDLAGRAGDPVRAAADGVVVYSGAGLVGYGELVIIKHDEQWLSAYGHNRSRRVNEGQVVKAGEQIAELGRSGAPRDMLHFEIRYNGKPVDPLLHLPHR